MRGFSKPDAMLPGTFGDHGWEAARPLSALARQNRTFDFGWGGQTTEMQGAGERDGSLARRRLFFVDGGCRQRQARTTITTHRMRDRAHVGQTS